MTSMARFITLAGKKQVGKDTCAQYIKRALDPKRVHVVHFADALKQACHEVYGIPLEDMETETGKKQLTDVRWPQELHVFRSLDSHVDKNIYSMWRPDDGRNDDVKVPRFMTVREVLQFVGTELFRNQVDPDTWVKSVYRKKYREDDIVVVADCRFPNEAEFAKEHGLLISVERDTGLAGDGHASETALDSYGDYDHVIDNNGSFGQLYAKLYQILTEQGLLVNV
jgi:hypothetical protein